MKKSEKTPSKGSFSLLSFSTKKISIIIALIYFFASPGFGITPPINLGATLYFSAVLLGLLIELQRDREIPRWITILAGFTEIVIIYQAITTNYALTLVSVFSILFVFSLLLALITVKDQVLTIGLYFKTIVILPLRFLREFFSSANIKDFRDDRAIKMDWFNKIKKRIFKRSYLLSIAVTILTLLVFHGLFSQVNELYREAVSEFFAKWKEYLMRFIRYIVDYFYIGFLAYITFTKFKTAKRVTLTPKSKIKTREWLIFSTILLSASILLFSFFDYFQIREILSLNYNVTANFERFSKYVQKGFWELIASAVFGFLIISLIKYKIETQRKFLSVVFLILLIVLDFFALHKVFGLITNFGLKDIRILAFAAILVIAVSLVSVLYIYLIQSDKKFKLVSSMPVIGYSLIMIVTFLNLINMSKLITVYSPPVFYHEGDRYIDYPFLLLRDYDNNSQYEQIFSDIKDGFYSGQIEYLQKPTSARWGYYPDIMSKEYGWFSHLSAIEVKYKIKLSPAQMWLWDTWNATDFLEDDSLIGDKYLEDLRFFFSINLHEIQTYRAIRDNRISYENGLIKDISEREE